MIHTAIIWIPDPNTIWSRIMPKTVSKDGSSQKINKANIVTNLIRTDFLFIDDTDTKNDAITKNGIINDPKRSIWIHTRLKALAK